MSDEKKTIDENTTLIRALAACLTDHSSNQLLEVHLVPFAVVCCEKHRQLRHPLLHFFQPFSELRLILDGLLAESAFARRGRKFQLRLTERLVRTILLAAATQPPSGRWSFR
jgi:hypothetical protein